ncbi:MAG TPA: MFS transporter [Caulobacteraceae bacterium]|nr:MFS transporter [Caulobacteraceae bacterium]
MSEFLERGSPAYRRATFALFCAGFSCFALLYCMQPLLPLLSRAFGVGAAGSSLAVSAATMGVAASLLVVGALSDRLGRKPVMAVSLFAVVGLNLAAAAAPDWRMLLLLRFASGLAISGVPAVAMAYLGEEVAPAGLGSAIGLYVAGNGIGGMAGRLLTGALVDLTGSWRMAMAGVGALGVVTAVIFVKALPPSRRFSPAPPAPLGDYVRTVLALFADPGLPWLFAIGFCLMGAFVAVFNLTSFRLTEAPYRLSNAAAGVVFLSYLAGAPVSAAFGRLGDRYGRKPVAAAGLGLFLAGLLLTLSANLIAIFAGVCLVTCGFFGVHALASAWTTSRAPHARGQASALYLQFVYLGPALVGAWAGAQWTRHGWAGVIALLAGWIGAALLVLLASPLRRLGGRP